MSIISTKSRIATPSVHSVFDSTAPSTLKWLAALPLRRKTGRQSRALELSGIGCALDHPFHNMSQRFWFCGWDDPRAEYIQDATNRSAVILVEQISEDNRYKIEEHRLEAVGYRPLNKICGQVFYPDENKPRLCHSFYEAQ
jgi:hypothetical protein